MERPARGLAPAAGESRQPLIAGAKAKYVVGVRQKTGASFETAAPVGFRQIAVKGTKILLNGEPVFFKGA